MTGRRAMRDPAPSQSYLLTDLIGSEREGDQLTRLAARVARLTPSHRDPERFHVEKSEIAADLRRLARERRP